MAKTWKERQAEESRTLHMEINYHLMNLHEAMESADQNEQKAQIKVLKEKRQALDRLGVTFRSLRI